jgi:glycosyltransferase involved in cell wall biosynthesis
MNPVLSVLICTRNRGEKIKNAVDSILANSFTDFELLIADQSTNDMTSKVISTYNDPRIRYIRTDTVGLSRSRNIAIRASKADLVVFTDDDCICDREWLSSITSEFENDPDLMGVYGRVLPFGEGETDKVCYCTIDSMERRSVAEPVIPYTVLGHGNNMSFRKKLFEKVGLFIESLGAGTRMKAGEDTEFIYRSLRKGMKFGYSPMPLVYHDNWLDKGKATEIERGYVLAAVAVFVKYAFIGDRLAFVHVLERGRDIFSRINFYRKQKNKTELLIATQRIRPFLMGLMSGAGYFFVSAPKFFPENTMS